LNRLQDIGILGHPWLESTLAGNRRVGDLQYGMPVKMIDSAFLRRPVDPVMQHAWRTILSNLRLPQERMRRVYPPTRHPFLPQQSPFATAAQIYQPQRSQSPSRLRRSATRRPRFAAQAQDSAHADTICPDPTQESSEDGRATASEARILTSAQPPLLSPPISRKVIFSHF
jgi:hypothetical protein